MKKNKFTAFLLVFMLSFSLAHSFVIEENHEHSDVREWVAEFTHHSHMDSEHNHDNILHCEFHNSYILAQNMLYFSNTKISLTPTFNPELYTYYKTDNFIKPPIA